MKTLYLDPGKTTGFYLGEYEPTWGQLTASQDTHLEVVWTFLDWARPERVVIERYIPGFSHADTSALEVIGVVKLWCQLNDVEYKLVAPPPTAGRPKDMGRHAAVAYAMWQRDSKGTGDLIDEALDRNTKKQKD